MLGLAAGVPAVAHAAATAQGVALNANASCGNADLDLTLTTTGAVRESGTATYGASTLYTFEQATTIGTFSGTYTGFLISPFTAPPVVNGPVLIGSYAYVGTTPPSAATTAEFFVYYNCSTRQVLLSCYGPYGTCPKTAAQAQAALPIPTLDRTGLALAMLLLALAASVALKRRT